MILCVGEILVDIFVDGDKRLVKPGGAPFNLAYNATLYTKDVCFAGCVGDDEEGKILLKAAEDAHFYKQGIVVSEVYPTSKAIVALVDGERSFRFDRDNGADYHLDLNQIDDELLNEGGVAHLGSLMLSFEEGRAFFDAAIKKIRKHPNVAISFDINYRDDIFSSPHEAKGVFLNALKKADILKFSNDELAYLSGEEEIEKGLKKLLHKGQVAVITLGKDGSIFYKDGRLIHVPSVPVKPVDTTGAGDAFYSYFIAAYHNDPSLVDDEKKITYCLKRANAVGALATLQKGAIGAAPSVEELEAFVERNC